MRKVKFILLLLAIASMTGRAQNSIQDFLISQEDTSCRFGHSSPVVFPDGDRRFLVIWQDDRNGPSGYFAQLLDSAANPIGNNFRIFSNSDVAFLSDNSFLVLGGVISSFGWPFDDAYYDLVARICKTDGSWTDPVTLGTAYLPWCGWGWLGYSHDLTPYSGGYLSSFNSSGHLSLSKRNWDGDTLWNWQMQDSVSVADSLWPAGISTCFNSVGDFAAVYFGVTEGGEQSRGTAGTFFDGHDSVLARNVVLRSQGTSIAGEYPLNSKIEVIPVSDSLYEIFVLGGTSKNLEYWKVDRRGTQIGSAETIALAADIPASINSWIRNFARSPIVNGSFSLFICIGCSRPGGDVLYRSVLNFDENGDMDGVATHDSTTDLGFTLETWFAKMSDGSFLLPVTIDNEIYLEDYRDFSLQWTKRVSDHVPGSNDLLSGVVPYDSGTFFVTWNAGKGARGRKIGVSGSTPDNASAIPASPLLFLAGGRSASLATVTVNDSISTYLYNIYDSGFKLEKSDTLVSGAHSYDCAPVMRTLHDSSLMILYRNGTDLALRRIRPDLNYSKISIPTASPAVSLQMIDENDTSLWIGYNGKIRLVNESLDQIGPEYTPPGGIYLGDQRFLLLSQQFQLVTEWGTIVSLDGDTLTPTFPISEHTDAITYQRLGERYFAAITRTGSRIYITTFDVEGSRRIAPMLVTPTDDLSRGNPVTCVDGNRLLVAWSEARIPGKGYDVYGRLFDIDKITGISGQSQKLPLAFGSCQNYPNPFNPSTTISYRLSAVSRVAVTVYDVLGRKVKTLVDARQTPGEHSVVFDGRGLASGVYFYRLSAGSYVTVKKMVLLK